MTNLPLRLESSFEQWWFVAPIDWAAANGHTEVVKELLRMDPSLFHNLTSKKRMRHLEKIWDDQNAFSDAAIGRSKVVKDLLQEFHIDQHPPKIKGGATHMNGTHHQRTQAESNFTDPGECIDHGLFKAGYGVWVLYIAAAAGDEGLVNQMITANPELIRGDGEFGLSDLLYAAARGQNVHIFQQILTLAKGVKASYVNGKAGDSNPVDVIGADEQEDLHTKNDIDYVGLSYNNRTIQSKALLAAARAGNVEMVRELLKDSSTHATVLSFRDSNGTTALHAAAGRGHLEVVKLILELCPSSIRGQDGRGNTALHTAARRGCLKVATEIMRFDKELIYTRNRNGETPLHSAVMGSKQPLPKLIMKQGGRIEVVKQLIASNNTSVPEYVNWKNNEGHTALHLSVMSVRIDDKLVALLLQSPGINVLETDNQGSTALDLARACRDSFPAAEFRCNIALSLLGAVVSGSTAAAGRPSTGPGSAAISVDLADPLMCSFSHDITIVSDGESRSSRWQNLARRSVSVDWTTEFQSGVAATGAPATFRADASDKQGVETVGLPDENTLSRNLAALRQTSAGIFETTSIGTPSPIQCFSALHSLFSSSNFRRPIPSRDSDQVWSRTLQWNNFRQCRSVREGSPQSLRQRFSSTDNILFHPNTPMEAVELRQEPAPSISVSPFASPTGSTKQPPIFSSPSYIKSWLKAVIVQNPSSLSPSPSKSSKRQRMKRRIKQITSLTHLSFSSASETHSIHDQHLDNADPHPWEQAVHQIVSLDALQSHGLGIDGRAPHMEDTLSTRSGQSSVQSHMECRQQCFCLNNLFQNNQHGTTFQVKEGQKGAMREITEAESFSVAASSMATDALANDLISTELNSSHMPLPSSGPDTPANDDCPQVPNAAITRMCRSGGSTPITSPRPSASLSLSPWLSPTLRAARKRDMVVPSAPTPMAIENDDEANTSTGLKPTTASSSIADHSTLSDGSAHAIASEPSSVAGLPLPLGSPQHVHRRTHSSIGGRQDSFSLCPCGPCFQDGEERHESTPRHRGRTKLYHT